MISGPYEIRTEQRSNGRWYVNEWAGNNNTVWGPYRWRWVARIVQYWVDMR